MKILCYLCRTNYVDSDKTTVCNDCISSELTKSKDCNCDKHPEKRMRQYN